MTDETEVCWNCKHYDKAKCYCATAEAVVIHDFAKNGKPTFIPTGPCAEWVSCSNITVFYQIRTYTPEMGNVREPEKFSTLKAATEKAVALVGQETQIIKVTEEVVK